MKKTVAILLLVLVLFGTSGCNIEDFAPPGNDSQPVEATVTNMLMDPLNGGQVKYYLFVRLESGQVIEVRTDMMVFHHATIGSRVLLNGRSSFLYAIAVLP